MPLKSSSTTSDSAPRGDSPDRWPVLARLPDVSEQALRGLPRSTRAAAAGFVSYRFDPPENAERGVGDADSAARARTGRLGETVDSRPGQPHIVQRANQDVRRGKSPILPHSNPFAIPRTSLHDTLAPVVRFLLLFVLFTAIGTTILTMTRRAEPVNADAEPAATVAQPSLELQNLEPPNQIIETPTAPPTAAGPLNTKTPRTGLRPKTGNRSAIENPQSAVVPAPPAPRIADANRLPQVQTTDRQSSGVGDDPARSYDPAREDNSAVPTARLSGSILAIPTQQAHHDDNESSLH